MPMTGTCQVFDLATKMLVYADGPAKRAKPRDGDKPKDFIVIRYVHRTLPPRVRIMTFALYDFLLFQEEGRPINEHLSYLNSSEQTFLLSGLTDEELVGEDAAGE